MSLNVWRFALRLRSIEIIGFKSFAEKIKLEFLAGITAIVGPNGCGKSNIADAFRWVLGEQSAKSMRGTKMPDVIFAGTSSRKPLNYAEVTITMTDIQGMLPVEYEEVAITRRLHRSGESEYFINRHPVRLKDVQSLFLDSGMGKDAYSIFEQGKIDQIINFTPLERRYIFEEAAGILRFLQRKREALRKLEQSDLNISRVKDIHQEVEKQIVVLEQQAEKARLFKQSKALLENLEKGVFVAKWDQLQNRSGEMGKKESDLRKQIAEGIEQLERLQAQLQEAKVSYAEGEKALRSRSEEVFKTRSDKEIKSREKLSNQERLKDALAKEKRWQQELELMQDRRNKRQVEQQNVQKQLKQFESEIGIQEAGLNAQREKVHALELEVVKLRELQQTLQQALMKLVQGENQIESELKQNTVRLESNQERKSQLTDKLQQVAQHADELIEQQQEKQKVVKEVARTLEEQKQAFAKLETEQHDLMEAIQQAQSQLDVIHREMTESKARQKVLFKLRDDMEGFSAGTKRLLQEAADPASPLYQKVKGVYEFINPHEGAEAAVAVVMRPYAQTLLVLTEADFEAVVAFAKQHKLKDYSLLCLEHARKESTSIQFKSLLEHVQDNEMARHFLQKVAVAKDLQTALKLGRTDHAIEVWVEEGGFLDGHQVVFYTTPGEQNVFVREAELKALDKKIKEYEATKADQENVLKAFHHRRTQLQNERLEMDKIIRKNEMKLVESNFAVQRLQADLEKSKLEAKHHEMELQSIGGVIEKLNAAIHGLQQRFTEAKLKVAESQQSAAANNGELERRALVLKAEQRALQEKEASFHKTADEYRKAQHAQHVLEVKDVESIQQEKRLEEEIHSSRELQSHIKVKTGEYEQILQEVEKLLATVLSACAEWEKEVSRRRAAIETVEGRMQEKRNVLKKLEGDLSQANVHSAQTEAARQALETELQERYRLSIADVRQMGIALEKPLDQTERQIRALRHEMESAGDINMTSIDEFEKHRSRYEFLNQQIDDMNVSKQELVQIIAQLDTESRKVFQETFEKVRANFKKNFKILFNGGEADLQFTETGDVLEAGIEIIAKPPAKQMRSINLLSGGEKCLTAMALLFAIFEVKPAPYCILDEIDAPLDDSNVERFLNVVKQFIDSCQFIIITHNKRTMAMADILFGVSMEEKGVSKILSMEFTKTERVDALF